jgi:hypothetical protein
MYILTLFMTKKKEVILKTNNPQVAEEVEES